MTPRDNELNRSLGRLEAQMEIVAKGVEEINTAGMRRDQALDDLKQRMAEVERKASLIAEMAEQIGTFELMVRDGKMVSRGMLIGIVAAAALVGAAGERVLMAVANFFRGFA